MQDSHLLLMRGALSNPERSTKESNACVVKMKHDTLKKLVSSQSERYK
jgi:hypothetical protein